MEVLKDITTQDYEHLKKYFELRNSECCENMIFDSYMWKRYYHLHYRESEKGLFWIYRHKVQCYSVTPLCRLEDMKSMVMEMEQFFNQVLQCPLEMYAVDKQALEAMELSQEEYEVYSTRGNFDYIYDAQKLRDLSGKKFHKKKNHLNAFLKEYEGRWKYKKLDPGHKDEILAFLERWQEDKMKKEEKEKTKQEPSNKETIEADERDGVDYEAKGIRYILEECPMLEYEMGGIYIDDRLEAFSMGSYNQSEEMAYIHVEKANSNIRGCYPIINQQFITHGFPQAKKVNREDDLNLEGLRKAKESYYPIYLVEKYYVKQKNFPSI